MRNDDPYTPMGGAVYADGRNYWYAKMFGIVNAIKRGEHPMQMEDLYYMDVEAGTVILSPRCEPRNMEVTPIGVLPDTFFVPWKGVTAQIGGHLFRDKQTAFDALLNHLSNQLTVIREQISRAERERNQ